MKFCLRTFYRCERGVLSIEFTLGFLVVFLPMFLLMMEVARLSYITAVLNLAVSEAAKTAKNTPQVDSDSYEALFRRQLTDNRGRLWHFITHKDAVTATVRFSKDISSLINDIRTRGGDRYAAGKPLARYSLQYTYHSMFFPLPADPIQKILRTEVTFVQEY